MNRAELIQSMTDKSGLSNKEVSVALDAFIDTIEEVLAAKDKITLVGFGTFQTAERAERTGRNPQTGKELKIAASTKVKFKAGSILNAAVTNGKTNSKDKVESKIATKKDTKNLDKANDKNSKSTKNKK